MRSLFLWVVLFALVALVSGQENPNGDGANAGVQPAPDMGADAADPNAPGSPALLIAEAPSVAPITIVAPAPNSTVVPVVAPAVPGAAPVIPRVNTTASAGSSAGSAGSSVVLAPIGASSQAMDGVAKVKPAPEVGGKNSTSPTTPMPSKKSGVSSLSITTLPFFAAGSAVLAMW